MSDDLRKTTITLRVAWDPAVHDHPGAWGWEELLSCDVDVVDWEDDKQTTEEGS